MIWAFDTSAITEVVRKMGITQPIYLRAHSPGHVQGHKRGSVAAVHDLFGAGSHRIFIRPTTVFRLVSPFLIHELQHAVQRERAEDENIDFLAAYEIGTERFGYEDNPFEVEARRVAREYRGPLLAIPETRKPKECVIWP